MALILGGVTPDTKYLIRPVIREPHSSSNFAGSVWFPKAPLRHTVAALRTRYQLLRWGSHPCPPKNIIFRGRDITQQLSCSEHPHPTSKCLVPAPAPLLRSSSLLMHTMKFKYVYPTTLMGDPGLSFWLSVLQVKWKSINQPIKPWIPQLFPWMGSLCHNSLNSGNTEIITYFYVLDTVYLITLFLKTKI